MIRIAPVLYQRGSIDRQRQVAALGSRNGTFINGERIGTDPRRLNNYDRIELGGTATRVQWVFMESQATIDVPRGSLEQ